MRNTLFIIILSISATLFVGCSSFVAESDARPSEQTEVKQQEEAEVEDLKPQENPDEDIKAENPEILLAKCLTEKGVKLYTASWCGHCQNQKAAFGDGVEYLNNTECAEGDGWAQECKDADVKSVPTWIFPDGQMKTGTQSLSELAKLAGCVYSSDS